MRPTVSCKDDREKCSWLRPPFQACLDKSAGRTITRETGFGRPCIKGCNCRFRHSQLVAAERADAERAHNYRRHCQARAYKTLRPILDAAIRQSARIETELAAFLKASPTLAHHVARWQADD
jgi:hypothetical protein